MVRRVLLLRQRKIERFVHGVQRSGPASEGLSRAVLLVSYVSFAFICMAINNGFAKCRFAYYSSEMLQHHVLSMMDVVNSLYEWSLETLDK